MKNILLALLIVTMSCSSAIASHKAGAPCHNHSHSHYYSQNHSSSSSSSNPVYLVNKNFEKKEIKFPNCDKHYVISEITTNYYSDGSKRIYTNSTIYNSDGSVLVTDCQNVKHIIYEEKHYFLVKQAKGYKILNDDGENISVKNYSRMEEIAPNRILVKYDKKYGVIDLNENIIIPIKYQNLDNFQNKIFVSKLNGYYGIVDINNNILVENDCEKIKPLYDTFVLKRYNKYGLTDIDGNIILDTQYNKIKKLGEYIIIKKNDKYGVFDASGNMLGDTVFKQIKLERNHLKGLKYGSEWIEINSNI